MTVFVEQCVQSCIYQKGGRYEEIFFFLQFISGSKTYFLFCVTLTPKIISLSQPNIYTLANASVGLHLKASAKAGMLAKAKLILR